MNARVPINYDAVAKASNEVAGALAYVEPPEAAMLDRIDRILATLFKISR